MTWSHSSRETELQSHRDRFPDAQRGERSGAIFGFEDRRVPNSIARSMHQVVSVESNGIASFEA
jgi:hypothetical protein